MSSQFFRSYPLLLTVAMLLYPWGHPVWAQAPVQVLQNSIGMAFVLIPAGAFMMGTPTDEPYRGKSEIQHQVAITRPFYMQTTEVTFGQWQSLMGKGFMFRWRGPKDIPVTKVSWYDVQNFLKKLNDLGEGTYRLPTEAEWEYAARAGSTTAYPWGDRIDCNKAMFANNKPTLYFCSFYAQTMRLPLNGPAPVKSYAPNAWGLYDMNGNVWEWVQDWFAPYSGHAQTDPTGPTNGTDRVRRGGSWFSPGYACRSANRAYAHPASRLRTTGFRVVRMVEE